MKFILLLLDVKFDGFLNYLDLILVLNHPLIFEVVHYNLQYDFGRILLENHVSI